MSNWDGIERREIYAHLPTKPFAIRRLAVHAPMVEGAAYGYEMVERRKVPDRRKKADKANPEVV